MHDVDTQCSCPGYQLGGYYAPTPAYIDKPCYFPSCDCTEIPVECPYQQTPAPTYYEPTCGCLQQQTQAPVQYYSAACGCLVDQSGQPIKSAASTTSTAAPTSNNNISPANSNQQIGMAAVITAAALAVVI